VAPVESNAVFAQLSPKHIAMLQAETVFALWNTPQSIVRWMTSFDTTGDEVDQFAEQIRRVVHDA
ncbi:MAG TPA: threonine aldolase, partial [Woeseiaceae bacterium]